MHRRNAVLLTCSFLVLNQRLGCAITPPTQTAASIDIKDQHADPEPTIEWEELGFGLNGVETDFIWFDRIRVVDSYNQLHGKNENLSSEYSTDSSTCLRPLSSTRISLHPAATVINYGQSLFEGLKAFRRMDGSIAIFRPWENASRLERGSRRLLMPMVPTDTFLEAITQVVRANARFVPPTGKGSLYLRPLLFGSGPGLGVKPSTETTFCIYASPVGNYFKGGLKCIKLQAVGGYSRAAKGGSGNIKAGGNYAPPFSIQKDVRQRGFDEALFLDASSGEMIEEAGASNFFAVFPNKTIVTPWLDDGTILPGVTRSSVIELARNELGYTIQERRLSIHELKDATEAFCCGTGASITPVGCVNYLDNSITDDNSFEVVFGDGMKPGPTTERIYQLLRTIQTGSYHDEDDHLHQKYAHWCFPVNP